MKKLLLLAILVLGTSFAASAQTYGVQYTPSFFGGGYHINGAYVGHTQFKSMLREDSQAYSKWNEGSANIATGYILLYPSAAVLGWGLGSLSYDDGAGAYVAIGGAGLIGAYLLLAKGQSQREEALFIYRNKKKTVELKLKPLINHNGGGIALTF